MSSIPPDKDESVSATPPELRGLVERNLNRAWEPVPDVKAPKHRPKTWFSRLVRTTWWENVIFAVIVVASLAIIGVYFRLFRQHDEEVRKQNERNLLGQQKFAK
jgi:hypothetical protein